MEKKLSEELKQCLEGKTCGECLYYELDTEVTCPGLLQKAYKAVKEYEEMDGLYAEKCRELAAVKKTNTDEIFEKHARLTTDKDVSGMSMTELAHNCCYTKDKRARYRDYDSDIDARELAIKLLDRYAGISNKFACDEDFDEFMSGVLRFGLNNRIGLIAAFYQNLWAMADLRERLKEYEDLEEQRRLLKLPCAVGDYALFSDGDIRPVVYITVSNNHEDIVVGCQNGINISMNFQYGSWCKGFFKTRQEAEDKLAEMEGKK